MIKVEMKLNVDRIIEMAKYRPERITGVIDEAFTKYGFRKEILKDGTICFWGNKNPNDFANFGKLVFALKEKDWFMPYVDKWLWYNSDGQYDENSYSTEDILNFFTGRKSVA